MKRYDLVVLGGGPAGEKAAVKAAYFGHKVAVVETRREPGGAGVHTGTLPSKTLKEAALYFSGRQDRGVFGVDRKLGRSLSIEDFFYRKEYVTRQAVHDVIRNLQLHKVDVYHGQGVFDDPHTIRVLGGKEQVFHAEFVLIATGSYPHHPEDIPFDGVRVHDSDTVLSLTRFPKSLCVVGAGVIGCEYSTIFATLGTQVFLLEGRDSILPFVDREVSTDLVRQMREAGVDILFKTAVESVSVPQSEDETLRVQLRTGETLNVDMLLYASGRSGNTAGLRLDKAGLTAGRRENIEVDADYRTAVPHIFAAGDVVGFPALASTSMDQGRIAVQKMFNLEGTDRLASVFPYGIYTVPEVSMVGVTEEEAGLRKLEVAVGRSRYKDMARGLIMGAQDGFLKMVVDRTTRAVLGVHLIGAGATELIHYGMTLVQDRKTVDEVVEAVFNFPTMHDLYKYAAYDALGVLRGHRVKT